jgi:serine/threonine protein kinase
MPVRLANQSEPIPGYKLIERLGRGGFGEVWKCEAPGGLHKAIKFVFGELNNPHEKSGAADQEFKALNRVKTVRHPFILSLERVDIVEKQLVIVMELADRSLQERYRECQGQGLPGIPREELLLYMEEAAEALDLMNIEYQLQHLDIKPQNLFLVRNHVKVADFGLVKDMEGMTASVTGGVTPVYAAPETFEGRVSRFCDQYSLAIVYQELLTGQRPFDGINARQLLLQHVQKPPDLSSLPKHDQGLIGRALAKKPDERFPTCSELVSALQAATPPEIVEPPPGAAPATDSTPTSRSVQSAAIVQTPRPQPINALSTLRSEPVGDQSAPDVTETSRSMIHASAPIEFRGNGVLVPAVVIGLGQKGLGAIQRFRQAIAERYVPIESLPHLRLLYIDTDPEGIGTALRSTASGASLSPQEVMLMRLNRPSHYLKPRDTHTGGGTPAISTWLDPKLLYRITRNQTTGSVRALGRLALVDNYRDVADRLRTALAACSDAEALASADRNSRLGLRINRPRIYIVTSLAGGTGSGMFLDVAYITRHFLKQLGYVPRDVIGVFFVPPADKQFAQMRPVDLGNTYAALTELNHYSSPGVNFSARYDSKESVLLDGDAPFTRCVFLPQEELPTENQPDPVINLGANFLLRDLLSPVGKTADGRRAQLLAARAGKSAVITKGPPPLQTLGMYRFSWPRRALIERCARKLSQRLVDHWLAKDSAPLRNEMQAWAREQFAKRGLEADRLIRSLKAAGENILDQEPEDAFDAIVEKLGKKGGIPEPRLVLDVLEELEKLVGRPDGRAPMPERPVLIDGLDEAAKTLLENCEQKMAEMTVHLVEQPRYRFAGAEESIRQINTVIGEILARQEPLCEEFFAKGSAAHARILGLVEAIKANQPGGRRKPPEEALQLPSLLRLYPIVRFQALVLQRVLTIYRSLEGNCPEYQREFTYCRTRLADLQKSFAKPQSLTPALELGPGRSLFPTGCKTLDDAVTQLLQNVTAEEILALDQRVEDAVIKGHFQALVHICTTPANNILREVETALQQELEEAVKTRLGTSNVLDTFLGQAHREAGAVTAIASAFDEALPKMTTGPLLDQVAVVLVPGDPAAEQFQQLVRKAVPNVEVVVGTRGDDVVFYREAMLPSLSKVPQLGPEGRMAYEKLCSAEHCTPHNRTDVTDWRRIE